MGCKDRRRMMERSGPIEALVVKLGNLIDFTKIRRSDLFTIEKY
jgi:hypothetical protein